MAVVVFALASPSNSVAGVFSDQLAACLVRSTTQEDKNYLVKWMFAAIASHPEVKAMASITPEQGEALNKGTAALFVKLHTESCRSEASEAFKNEGRSTIDASFAVLGSVAVRGLVAHPDVTAFTAVMVGYVDEAKMQEIFEIQ